MSVGTQKHTPELIEKWLNGFGGWDYPQDDWFAGRCQGFSVDKRHGIFRNICLRTGKFQNKHLFNSDKEALDWVVSRAISGNALAIKALCYLSHHNPSEYGHWGKLLKGMYGKEGND